MALVVVVSSSSGVDERRGVSSGSVLGCGLLGPTLMETGANARTDGRNTSVAPNTMCTGGGDITKANGSTDAEVQYQLSAVE